MNWIEKGQIEKEKSRRFVEVFNNLSPEAQKDLINGMAFRMRKEMLTYKKERGNYGFR